MKLNAKVKALIFGRRWKTRERERERDVDGIEKNETQKEDERERQTKLGLRSLENLVESNVFHSVSCPKFQVSTIQAELQQHFELRRGRSAALNSQAAPGLSQKHGRKL